MIRSFVDLFILYPFGLLVWDSDLSVYHFCSSDLIWELSAGVTHTYKHTHLQVIIKLHFKKNPTVDFSHTDLIFPSFFLDHECRKIWLHKFPVLKNNSRVWTNALNPFFLLFPKFSSNCLIWEAPIEALLYLGPEGEDLDQKFNLHLPIYNCPFFPENNTFLFNTFIGV